MHDPLRVTEATTTAQPAVRLHAADGASALIYLQGAHVASWTTPDGAEQLFLSHASHFASGKAIRGGVPVCWPQFADQGPLPAHGFARTLPWQVERPESQPVTEGEPVQPRLLLRDSDATRALWPHRFALRLAVQLAGPMLELTLEAENLGSEPFAFTAALHTYLRVDDVADAAIEGLYGLRYRDKVAGNMERTETARTLRIEGETDRIYFAPPGPVTLRTPGRSVQVQQEGFTDIVIWNPGPQRAALLPDLEAGGWQRMLCIESAAIEPRVLLAPGARWQGTQRLAVQNRG